MATAARLFVPPQQFPRLEANVDTGKRVVIFVAQRDRFTPAQTVVVPFDHIKQTFYALLGLELGAIQDPASAAAAMDPLARAVAEYDRHQLEQQQQPEDSSTSGGLPDPARDPSRKPSA